jgi:hypothetical protein
MRPSRADNTVLTMLRQSDGRTHTSLVHFRIAPPRSQHAAGFSRSTGDGLMSACERAAFDAGVEAIRQTHATTVTPQEG